MYRPLVLHEAFLRPDIWDLLVCEFKGLSLKELLVERDYGLSRVFEFSGSIELRECDLAVAAPSKLVGSALGWVAIRDIEHRSSSNS